MKKILQSCEEVIITTEFLAKVLKKYMPKVFINHNVDSGEKLKLSECALKEKLKV